LLPSCFELDTSSFDRLIEIAKEDEESQETSVNYHSYDWNKGCLYNDIIKIRNHWDILTQEMLNIERKDNKNVLDYFNAGCLDKLAKIEPHQITLTNDKYFGVTVQSEDEVDKNYLSNRIISIISYIIGCQMGRYSLDREGLVYAHEGNKGFSELVA
ncbi:hypothetical protein ACSLOK_25530, partial [Escherichia coli]